MSQVLNGMCVINLTHNQAGRACAQILGFLGADVIEFEEPNGGDVAAQLEAPAERGGICVSALGGVLSV